MSWIRERTWFDEKGFLVAVKILDPQKFMDRPSAKF